MYVYIKYTYINDQKGSTTHTQSAQMTQKQSGRNMYLTFSESFAYALSSK